MIGPRTFHLAFCLCLCLSLWQQALAQDEIPLESIDSLSAEVSDRVVAWRRDFHQNPELSNREFRTAGIVAEHLAGLGMEVQTGVAHTGVVGLLRGRKPGPVVLLRADMDGLPVPERNDLPFRSTAIGEYNGEEVPVMHACGHDSHVAILMGVAEILAEMRDDLPGTVKFVFQPAEEGAPKGEQGGAELMVAEGVLENPPVDAAFALHISGVRSNIIPEQAEMVGTIRALDQDMREQIHRRIREIATGVAQSMGATVDVHIPWSNAYPITYNDPQLAAEMRPVLEAVAGPGGVDELKPITGAEDFSFFANEAPGFYISLGGKPPGTPDAEVAAHHTPGFYIDESGFDVGVRAMAAMTWQYLLNHRAE